MNIALLFFGRIKFYEMHFQSYDTIRRNNNVDIFLATNPELNKDISGFVELYKPVSVFFKPNIQLNVEFNHIDFSKFTQVHRLHEMKNLLPQYFNRKRVSELLEEYMKIHNKHYDLVILHRLDISGTFIDFDQIEKDDKIIYIPENNDFHKGYNDRMIIATPSGMKLACNLYDNAIQYLEDGCAYHPESIHRWHLDKCGFTVKRFKYNTEIRR